MHVELEIDRVEFKKRLCRCVNFRGVNPHLDLRQRVVVRYSLPVHRTLSNVQPNWPDCCTQGM